MNDAWAIFLGVAAGISALTVTFGGVAWLVWPRLKEFLHSELITPVQETRHEVVVNGGKGPSPTLKDDVKKLFTALEHLARQLDRHLDWSEYETRRIWQAIRDRTSD